MSTLRGAGYRLLVNPDPFKVEWIHPAEVSQLVAAGWKDATDMDDPEYDSLIDSCTSKGA